MKVAAIILKLYIARLINLLGFGLQFLNWMHNKLNGGQGSRKCNAVPTTSKPSSSSLISKTKLHSLGAAFPRTCMQTIVVSR